MPLIDYAFRDNGNLLQLVCDVAAGWRRATRTYCYSEECRNIELSGGFSVRARVNVFPFPVTLSSSAAGFVLISAHQGGDHAEISYSASRESLRIDVRLYKPSGDLNETLPWDHTVERRKLCLKWEDVFYDAGRSYRIGLMAVFNPPPNAPGPVEWEKGEGFLSGGLPSLGRRR
jgi:hypothetical protein